MITSFFHPNYPRVFPEMNQNGVSLYIITTPEVIETMRTYHADIFGELLKSESFHLYVYPGEMGIQVVAFNDHRLLLRLLTNDKHVDINHMLCSNPYALQWGKELFDHYMKGSQPVNEL